MTASDTRTMSELLGGSQVTEAVQAVQHEIEGLSIEWIHIAPVSTAVGRTIGAGEYRTRTGASIVAVIRADRPIPAPEPEFLLEAGDVVVAVGTIDGLAALRPLLSG
jgi:TrkA domain protein